MKIRQQFISFKAFIDWQGTVLILQESGEDDERTNVGKWDVPGGRLKIGEVPLDGLAREVLEETGLKVILDRPFSIQEWRPVIKDVPSQIVAVFVRCTTATDKVTLSDEHQDYRWISPNKYRAMDIIPNLKKVFEEYQKIFYKINPSA